MAEKKLDNKIQSTIRKSTFILIGILISSLFLTFTSVYFFFESLFIDDVQFLFKYSTIHFFSAKLKLNVFPIIASSFILFLYIINLFGLDRLFANVLKIRKHLDGLNKDIFLKRAYRFFYETDAYKLFVFITFILIPLIALATIMYKFLALHDLRVLLVTSLILVFASISSLIFLVRRYEEFDFHELADHFIGLIFILFLTIVFIYLYFIFLSFINASQKPIFKWITFIIVPLPMIIYMILAVKVFPKNKKVLDVTQLFIPVIFLIMAIVVFIVNIVFIYMKDIPKKYKYAYSLIPKIEVTGKEFIKLYLMGIEHYVNNNIPDESELEQQFYQEFQRLLNNKEKFKTTLWILYLRLFEDFYKEEDIWKEKFIRDFQRRMAKRIRRLKKEDRKKIPKMPSKKEIKRKIDLEYKKLIRKGELNLYYRMKKDGKKIYLRDRLKYLKIENRFRNIYNKAILNVAYHIQEKKIIDYDAFKELDRLNKNRTGNINNGEDNGVNKKLIESINFYIEGNLKKIFEIIISEYYDEFFEDISINMYRWLLLALRPIFYELIVFEDKFKKLIEEDFGETSLKHGNDIIYYLTGDQLPKALKEFFSKSLHEFSISRLEDRENGYKILKDKKFMFINLVSDEIKKKYIYYLLLKQLMEKKILAEDIDKIIKNTMPKDRNVELDILKFKIILDTLDFRNKNLRYIHLLNVYSELANFENADLKGANIPLSILNYVNFTNTDLSYSKLTSSLFLYSLFINTIFKETDLSKSYISNSLFYNVKLENTTLREAYILKSLFVKPKFINNDLRYTYLKNSIFIEPKFENITLNNSNLPESSLFLVSNPEEYPELKNRVKFNNLNVWYNNYGKRLIFYINKEDKVTGIKDKIFFIYFIYTLNYIKNHPLLSHVKEEDKELGEIAGDILEEIKGIISSLKLKQTERDILMVVKEEDIPIPFLDEETYKAILIILTIVLTSASICYYCRNRI